MKDLNRVQASFMASFDSQFSKEMGLKKEASAGPDIDLMTIVYSAIEETVEKEARKQASK